MLVYGDPGGYIQKLNLVKIVAADAGDKPLAGTVLMKKLNMSAAKFLVLLMGREILIYQTTLFKMSLRFTKSHGTTSVKTLIMQIIFYLIIPSDDVHICNLH